MGYQEFRFYGKNPYLGFQSQYSVPVSIQNMSDFCFHTDKEDPSSLLLTHSISGGMWNKSCTLCSVLNTKDCQDSSIWDEARESNKSITHLWHRAQRKSGPKSWHTLFSISKKRIPLPLAQHSPMPTAVLQNRNELTQKAIAGDL